MVIELMTLVVIKIVIVTMPRRLSTEISSTCVLECQGVYSTLKVTSYVYPAACGPKGIGRTGLTPTNFSFPCPRLEYPS